MLRICVMVVLMKSCKYGSMRQDVACSHNGFVSPTPPPTPYQNFCAP